MRVCQSLSDGNTQEKVREVDGNCFWTSLRLRLTLFCRIARLNRPNEMYVIFDSTIEHPSQMIASAMRLEGQTKAVEVQQTS